jgi:histone H3/H4
MRREREVRRLAFVKVLAMASALVGLAPRLLPAQVWMGYDSISGYNTIELRPTPVTGERDAIAIHVVAVFKGRVFATPQYVSVAFIDPSGRARIGANPAISIMADAARLWSASSSEVSRTTSGDTVRAEERVAMRMPTPVLQRIASATGVSAHVGAASVRFSSSAMEALREFAARLTAEGYERAVAAAQHDAVATSRAGLSVRKDWYEPTEVDERAAPTVFPEKPKYPVVAAEDRVRREFLVEFIVDTTGHATLRNVRSTGGGPVDPYVSALRAAMARWEYAPAKKNGRPVPQIVRQVVVFDPR